MKNKLKYKDNENILCSKCNKPVYMGITSKNDSELCTCRGKGSGENLVYDKRDETKKLVPLENFYEYE